MRLNRAERDWYSVSITTTPTLAGTWQASFDAGTTWLDGTASDGTWAWLIAGPDFDATAVGMDAADTQATVTRSLRPLLRIADAPVLDVETGPTITLV